MLFQISTDSNTPLLVEAEDVGEAFSLYCGVVYAEEKHVLFDTTDVRQQGLQSVWELPITINHSNSFRLHAEKATVIKRESK